MPWEMPSLSLSLPPHMAAWLFLSPDRDERLVGEFSSSGNPDPLPVDSQGSEGRRMKSDQLLARPSQNASKIQLTVGCEDGLMCKVLAL